MDCFPAIEKANASVTVEARTGIVLEYKILDEALPALEAWVDQYQERNLSSTNTDAQGRTVNYRNYTLRYAKKSLLGLLCLEILIR